MKNKIKKRKNQFSQTFSRAWHQATPIAWKIVQVYIPISILVTILHQLGLFSLIAPKLEPVMRFIGLPGDAAIVLISGACSNLMVALALMSVMEFDIRQITIISIMIGIAHDLFIEAGVLIRLGLANFKIIGFRIMAALGVGYCMNLCLPKEMGDCVQASIEHIPYTIHQSSFWYHISITSLELAAIIIVLTWGYELLVSLHWVDKIEQKVGKILRLIGLSEKVFIPWFVGCFLGILYGVGILVQCIKEKDISHKDQCLLTIFLCCTHAIIEDSLFFSIMGADFTWMVSVRLLLSILLVRVLSLGKDTYKRFLWVGLPNYKP